MDEFERFWRSNLYDLVKDWAWVLRVKMSRQHPGFGIAPGVCFRDQWWASLFYLFLDIPKKINVTNRFGKVVANCTYIIIDDMLR